MEKQINTAWSCLAREKCLVSGKGTYEPQVLSCDWFFLSLKPKSSPNSPQLSRVFCLPVRKRFLQGTWDPCSHLKNGMLCWGWSLNLFLWKLFSGAWSKIIISFRVWGKKRYGSCSMAPYGLRWPSSVCEKQAKLLLRLSQLSQQFPWS